LKCVNFNDYEKWHKNLIDDFEINLCYGVGAKFIAVFMKTYYVINDYEKYKNIIYPPIDSRILQIIKDKFGRSAVKITSLKWTKMSKEEHNSVIAFLKNKSGYLYQFEECWEEQ